MKCNEIIGIIETFQEIELAKKIYLSSQIRLGTLKSRKFQIKLIICT